MAPTSISRKTTSQTRSGVVRTAHRKSSRATDASTTTCVLRSKDSLSQHNHLSGSSSWEFLEGEQRDIHDDEEEEEEDGAYAHARLEDHRRAELNPLHNMVERVGKEVETFAETLDRFFTDLPPRNTSDDVDMEDSTDVSVDARRFEAAKELVREFREIAEETVRTLKKNHERERLLELRKEWSANAAIPPVSSIANTTAGSTTSAGGRGFAGSSLAINTKKAEQVAQLRKWQQEADLWELFRLTLETHPPKAAREALRQERREKLRRLGTPHRYTPESDLWTRFLLEDDLARERNLVKRWLETTATHQDSDLAGIVEELETRAGRGTGLWSSGWLHTRERIKAEKRLRSWPNASDSPLPQIRRSDTNDLLVTQLDPDASGRQQRTLEKQDSFFERALWVVCWEMLRRGTPYSEVCDWCEERKEGWRAVSLGRSSDDHGNAATGETWRRMCALASESGCANEYEAAVYGLLGGNVRAVLKVCRSFDDHLYAYYSSMLLRQFNAYVAQSSPETNTIARQSTENEEEAENAVVDLLIRLRKGSSTKAEASQPLKTIQGYLLGNMAPSLITTVGAMIALTARTLHSTETTGLIEPPPADVPETAPEIAVALDPQTLRIVAHMAIILGITHLENLEPEDRALEENVLVAYMQALRAAGKRDHIPLYASQLQPSRYVKALGRMLPDVTEPREQREMLQLLQAFDMNLVDILNAQLQWTVETFLAGEVMETPLRILEKTEETKLWPGQRIHLDFMPDKLEPADEAVLNCLQWFMLLSAHWDTAFAALTSTLRRCLIIGRFACARAIVERFPYEEVSMQKSYETIGRTINIMDDRASRPSDEHDRLLWNLLRRQSQTYYELELLVRAIESVSDWRFEEHTYVTKTPKPTNVPSALKRAKEAVSAALHPLCSADVDGILLHPFDDAEAVDLPRLRRAYFPELVLAYNVVLHAAGNLITRDSLLESMDLSASLARGENGLLAALQDAKRLRELVSMFALTSKAMLVLKAEGKPWKPRKDREGRDLGLWEIGGRRQEEDGILAMEV